MEDLYDEFGNFIGEVDESEEEEQVDTTADAYLQDEEEENEAEVNNQQLMQIDGMCSFDVGQHCADTLIRRWAIKCSHPARR